MSRSLTIMAAALLSLTIVSCSSTPKRIKGYEGAEKPLEQMATMEVASGVVIHDIDGNRDLNCEPFSCEFVLAPGKHRFTVGYNGNVGTSGLKLRSVENRVIELSLERGHAYTISAWEHSEKPTWWVVVTDSTAKTIVYKDRDN